MPSGEVVKMRLCEMGSLVGSGKDATWMRQVRKLTDSGHQTSLISTAFDLPYTQLATRMFSELKQTSKHIKWGEFDEKDKFLRLLPGRKRLMDTVRMIAYRAETAMVGLITGPTVDSSDARRLLQDLFSTEADILPEPENDQLNIRVHSASRPAANRALAQLFEHLNNAEVKYPGTETRLTFELGGYNALNHSEGVR
jgi:hypothetical protein